MEIQEVSVVIISVVIFHVQFFKGSIACVLACIYHTLEQWSNILRTLARVIHAITHDPYTWVLERV